MAREALRFFEKVVEIRRAFFVALHVWNVTHGEFSRDLRRPRFVAEENNLWARRDSRPARHRIALDDADMPFERFGHREEGEQLLLRKMIVCF